MEIEPPTSTQIIPQKIWSILRIILMMVKKGISKSKLIMDINFLLKRGNQLAGKAINGLIIHHNSLICKSNNQFISPKEYEFSCSNTPIAATGAGNHHKKRRNAATVAAVQRVLEMLNGNNEVGPMGSPLGPIGLGQAQYALPGFGYGKSPLARQLRVTDSPFPLKEGKKEEEDEEDLKVNKAADEFIKKFYRNLKMQKSLESPYHTWAR